ncbi:uncharacterized protein LOC121387780 [Gigantopelta aegis]|uniref:uncharacterized protein LOC121387780 n=1 Tax=Gigantopelta aegis TaxID=1735272 RepID=UPI001B88E2BB|nr:uncharacterized protein LOC121387780 [Gigantopelta aegis]
MISRAFSALTVLCLYAVVTEAFQNRRSVSCPVCSEILANIASGKAYHLSYKCKCVVRDLKMSMAQLQTANSNLKGQVTGLTAHLGTTQSELDATRSQLNATQSQLDTSQSQMNATQSQLNATQSQLDATQSQLNATQSELNATQSQLDTSQSQLDATQSELNATQSQLDDANQRLQNVCPNSSAIKAACNANSNFTFLTSDNGCVAICYHVSNSFEMSYPQAKTHCSDAGGALITLDTMEKNALMLNTIRTLYKGKHIYIGLRKVDGQWLWEGTGNQATFTDWFSGPSKFAKCTVLNHFHQHRWNNQNCKFHHFNAGALCELTVA